MSDQTSKEIGYGDTDCDSSEVIPMERAEYSESGIITEMEHRRSESMSSVDMRALTSEDGTSQKRDKSRRLSTRVARGIKKQFKADKSRPRSLSPPRSLRSLTSEDEGERALSPRRTRTDSGGNNLEPKKKHKSKFKPVAKAAAAAAKKLSGKKSSSSHSHNSKHCHGSVEPLSDGSRSVTPTNLHIVHPPAVATNLAVGMTPVNTPVDATFMLDGSAVDNTTKEFPETLLKAGEEELEAGKETEISTTLEEPAAAATQEDPAPAPEPEPLQVSATPTEDELLRLAEAMALAVQNNPTKSQDEIRRMVYSHPEFKHLAPPLKPSSDSTSKLLKKNFSSIKKQITSGAGTAQKKFMEMAESNLGSSITSFSFGISSQNTAKPPTPTAIASTEQSAKDAVTSSFVAAGSTAPTSRLASNATIPPVSTIPETSQLSLEHSVSTSGMSHQSSTGSVATTAATTGPSEEFSKATAPLTTSDSATTTTTTTTTIGSSSSKKWRELPIKISDIVWKRRSGFGKFSTDAWERRRFVLQGNVLSYYRAKGNTTEPMEDETDQFDEGRCNVGPSMMADQLGMGASSKPSTKKRMFDYMEQVAVSAGLAASAVAEKTEEEKKSSARGYMDLIKENAVICATLGHSGAPSPFCLSIKVGGETKWKLCFSSHRSQLQWMAAISDVIVQASVDVYNVKLLTKADPTNHDPTQAFHASVYEPPNDEQQPTSQNSMLSSKNRDLDREDEYLPQPSLQVSGKRLWIMEPYVIRPQDDEENEGEDGDDVSVDSSSSSEENRHGETADRSGETDPFNDRNVWSLPEKNLTVAAVIINAAILYARNSTMSVQSFWTVVTAANMVLFAFLESKPRLDATAPAIPQAARKVRKSRKKKVKKTSVRSGGADNGADKDGTGAKIRKDTPYKPMAGMSAIKVQKPEDPKLNAKGDVLNSWCAVEGETIQVRSHGYMATRAKIPSPGTLYEIAQMDIFESPARYPDMAPRVKLPKLAYEILPDEEKTWKSPDHFVVSLSLPTDPPKLGASTSDGGGYTVTMYYTMRKTTRDILKRVTAEGYQPSSEEPPEDIQKSQVNAVRLFEEWIRRAPNDLKFQTRFKMVPNAVNAKEIGLPSWIGKYNGKPLLIKRPGQTGFLYPHPDLSCVEFDISLHVFPYLAKQGICYLKDTMFKKILATVGFVIEGRDDDELPEVLIGLAQVCYPDPDIRFQAAEFFAGTAPRSFESEDATKALLVAPVAQPASEAMAPERPVE